MLEIIAQALSFDLFLQLHVIFEKSSICQKW